MEEFDALYDHLVQQHHWDEEDARFETPDGVDDLENLQNEHKVEHDTADEERGEIDHEH
ncbi:MAG TPA: hypothetical protein VFK94_06660 [Patescibacteria group bacterium]|nr:hypothetical protein [Patescibacteria group bacterium]